MDAVVTKPSAKGMCDYLDPTNALGVDTQRKGISEASNSLYDFALHLKSQHPRAIVILRNGKFYEAYGFDAVVRPAPRTPLILSSTN